MNSNRGFSLVELMVSVSIIGILASIGTVNFGKFAGRAKYARAKAEMSQMSSVIQGLRIHDDKVLSGLTGSTCTCTGYAQSSWQALGYDTVPVDPWGSMYIIDENENEFPNDCRNDWILTTGADRQWAGSMLPAQGDDAHISVPWFGPHPDCGGPQEAFTLGPDFPY